LFFCGFKNQPLFFCSRLALQDDNVDVIIILLIFVLFKVLISISPISYLFEIVTSVVNAQSTAAFADGEGQRVYDLLDGLGCIGHSNCDLSNFTPTTPCNDRGEILKCDDGRLAHL
jgi:hypothetical protein